MPSGCLAPWGGLLEGLRLCSQDILLFPTTKPLPHPSLSPQPRAGLFSPLQRTFEIPSWVTVLGEDRTEIPRVSGGAPGSFRHP